MKRLCGGIDVGSERHHVIIMDDKEKILFDREIEQKYSDFNEAIEEFREIEAKEKLAIEFAMEGKNGYGTPFDRLLIENGFRLYNVDNLKLRRFKDVFGAEWRNDQRDAKMIAKMLKLREHVDKGKEKAFIEVTKMPSVNEKLKVLSRHQQSLINEKIRMQNRLRKRVQEVCPDILEFGDTDSKKLLRLLITYPDFRKYKKLTMEALLKIKMIGTKQAALMIDGLRDIQCFEEMAETYKTIISSSAKRVLELKEEIEMLDKMLEELGEQSHEVKRLISMPGIGIKLSSRFVGEVGDINRFEKEDQLAVYCGVACIDDDSGKSKKTRVVYKANRICKATLIEIAGCTIRYIPESKAYYDKKRAEGKKHNHALRCLARQVIKVLFKMLKEDRDYVMKEEVKKAA
ncbi:MAG: IS110 family transposase [Candidatus Brocadiales bacterium]|nr:IS110 family transposase [Candidatus Brocadiales bacterium]